MSAAGYEGPGCVRSLSQARWIEARLGGWTGGWVGGRDVVIDGFVPKYSISEVICLDYRSVSSVLANREAWNTRTHPLSLIHI